MISGLHVLLLSTVLAATPLAPGDTTRELMYENVSRPYLVHLPPSYVSSRPVPVVLVLHPAMMNASMMAGFCGLNDTADRAGFAAVYANGSGTTPLFRYWDAGGVRGRVSNDVGYVAKLLDDLATVLNVDPRRVYAAGMSNGGMMCYRLAAELSDRIAAIAAIAGTMAIHECRPGRPVPVLHFHGTKDGLVLFGGPDERIPKNLKFLSVDDTMRAWVKANGCPASPTVTLLPDREDDGTSVKKIAFGPGRDGSEVILYVIKDGGHTWPGREPRLDFLGKSSRDISANDLMWEFFERHPMK